MPSRIEHRTSIAAARNGPFLTSSPIFRGYSETTGLQNRWFVVDTISATMQIPQG